MTDTPEPIQLDVTYRCGCRHTHTYPHGDHFQALLAAGDTTCPDHAYLPDTVDTHTEPDEPEYTELVHWAIPDSTEPRWSLTVGAGGGGGGGGRSYFAGGGGGGGRGISVPLAIVDETEPFDPTERLQRRMTAMQEMIDRINSDIRAQPLDPTVQPIIDTLTGATGTVDSDGTFHPVDRTEPNRAERRAAARVAKAERRAARSNNPWSRLWGNPGS